MIVTKPQGLSKPTLKVIPISGLEFVGANCTAIEYGETSIVIDAGLGFPSLEHLGVDFIIPNLSYFKKNAKRIQALVITHGHLDHIGAIPFVIEAMGFPTIYASKFASYLIKAKLREDFPEVESKIRINLIDENSALQFGQLKVEFFRVNHSIPESMGVILKTPAGNIVHTGDFKFDNAPINEPPADYAKIARAGSEGVLCLLSDSTNSYKEGHSLSESEISRRLETLLAELKGRVIVATFGSMVNRIMELLKIALKYNRKVFVSGHSMKVAIEIARQTGYINLPESLFVNGAQIKSIADNQLMILATGSQGEPIAALGRMARNEHKEVKIQKGDTVIISASVIPGNGALVQEMIDKLSKYGANVYHNEIMNLHTTGHGHKEEQKLMINLVRPKFFLPIHGFRSFLTEHAKTAQEVGIKSENIIMADDGDIVVLDSTNWRKAGKYIATPVNVSGTGVGDVGNIVLEDRQQLASYGVVAFSAVWDSTNKKLAHNPMIQSRGFVFVKESQTLIEGARKIIAEGIHLGLTKGETIINTREKITQDLKKYFYQNTEREPVILGMIDVL